MHFFSPANVMPLLENVRGAKSSARTIATAMAVGSAIGKWPVLVRWPAATGPEVSGFRSFWCKARAGVPLAVRDRLYAGRVSQEASVGWEWWVLVMTVGNGGCWL